MLHFEVMSQGYSAGAGQPEGAELLAGEQTGRMLRDVAADLNLKHRQNRDEKELN